MNTPNQVVVSFLTDVDSVRSNAMLSQGLAQSVYAMAARSYKEFLDVRAVADESGTRFVIPIDELRRNKKLHTEFVRSQRAVRITSRASLVSLVSQYDAFLSGLVRTLFKAQPGLVKCSKKSFDVSEIFSFNNMEEVRDAITDEEIEALLRESHHEQFAWLERRFEIQTLRKNLSSWPPFVELTQRRNLFVHTDGMVSKQYLKVCS
jgi:hypothetical protein